MIYVTGRIGDRVHTVSIDHGNVQADASLAHILQDLGNRSDAAVLAQCRLLFGDTMQVSDAAPQPVAMTPPSAGQVVNETQVQPPAMPGSVPMGSMPASAVEAKAQGQEGVSREQRAGRGN